MSHKDFSYKDIASVENMFLGNLNQRRIRRLLWTSETRDILKIAIPSARYSTEARAVDALWDYFNDPEVPDNEPPTCKCEPARGLRWHKVDEGDSVTLAYIPSGEQWGYAASIRQAMRSIENVADIKFEYIVDPDRADIVVRNALIDGEDGTLGQAYQPASGDRMAACGPMCGDIFIDLAENWHIPFFQQVFLHELFHAIGVKHSRSRNSIMYPSYQGPMGMSEEDILELTTRYPFEAPIV